jgi:hypothetical protein
MDGSRVTGKKLRRSKMPNKIKKRIIDFKEFEHEDFSCSDWSDGEDVTIQMLGFSFFMPKKTFDWWVDFLFAVRDEFLKSAEQSMTIEKDDDLLELGEFEDDFLTCLCSTYTDIDFIKIDMLDFTFDVPKKSFSEWINYLFLEKTKITKRAKKRRHDMIFKRKYEGKFTTIPNQLIEDSGLGWKAKAILIYLLSKPATWQTKITDIVNNSPDGMSSVRAGIKELVEASYIIPSVIRDEKKRISEFTYDVFDERQDVIPRTTPQFQSVENQLFENQEVDNSYHNNNNLSKNLKNSKTELYNAKLKILDFWNAQKIVQHKIIDGRIPANINKALGKKLKEIGPERIIRAIKTYSIVINDIRLPEGKPKRFFYDYRFTLTNFLTRQNAFEMFFETDPKITIINSLQKNAIPEDVMADYQTELKEFEQLKQEVK